MDWTPYVAAWIVCGLIAGAIANRRRADVNTGLLMGFLLGPLGVLLALTSKPKLVPPFSAPGSPPSEPRQSGDRS